LVLLVEVLWWNDWYIRNACSLVVLLIRHLQIGIGCTAKPCLVPRTSPGV
jgi:hypothetical protein